MEKDIFADKNRLLDPDDAVSKFHRLFRFGAHAPFVVAGVNEDDCAVLDWGEGLLVLSADFLNSKPIAVELSLGSYWDLGRLAIASSLSDLCGSGASPQALLFGARMPRQATYGELELLLKGAEHEASTHQVPIVGGDTKLGSDLSLFSVGVGIAKSRDNLFLKRAARPGDILWTSGSLGSCAAALIGLSYCDMPLDWKEWARARILVPNLPLIKSRQASEMKLGRGGIDISDGLGNDLRRLCEASGVGVDLEVAQIPIDEKVLLLATRLGLSPWSIAFASGGDFQFLLSSDSVHSEALINLGFTRIGTLTQESSLNLLLEDGRRVPLPMVGHRDGRRQTFAREALDLAEEAFRAAAY